MLIYSKSNYYNDTIMIFTVMANFIGTVLHWYKKRVPNFTTQSNKKCAYMHMYNFMLYISIYKKNTY